MYTSSESAVILSKSCKILYLSPPNITENCQFNCSVDYVIERAREGGGGGARISSGPYIPSDMGPGTGSHIASDMRPEGRITLGISDRGAPPPKGGVPYRYYTGVVLAKWLDR